MGNVSKEIRVLEAKLTAIEERIVSNKLDIGEALSAANMAKEMAQAAKDVCWFKKR